MSLTAGGDEAGGMRTDIFSPTPFLRLSTRASWVVATWERGGGGCCWEGGAERARGVEVSAANFAAVPYSTSCWQGTWRD